MPAVFGVLLRLAQCARVAHSCADLAFWLLLNGGASAAVGALQKSGAVVNAGHGQESVSFSFLISPEKSAVGRAVGVGVAAVIAVYPVKIPLVLLLQPLLSIMP